MSNSNFDPLRGQTSGSGTVDLNCVTGTLSSWQPELCSEKMLFMEDGSVVVPWPCDVSLVVWGEESGLGRKFVRKRMKTLRSLRSDGMVYHLDWGKCTLGAFALALVLPPFPSFLPLPSFARFRPSRYSRRFSDSPLFCRHSSWDCLPRYARFGRRSRRLCRSCRLRFRLFRCRLPVVMGWIIR
jgi:hypothetical protein